MISSKTRKIDTNKVEKRREKEYNNPNTDTGDEVISKIYSIRNDYNMFVLTIMI